MRCHCVLILFLSRISYPSIGSLSLSQAASSGSGPPTSSSQSGSTRSSGGSTTTTAAPPTSTGASLGLGGAGIPPGVPVVNPFGMSAAGGGDFQQQMAQMQQVRSYIFV